MLPRNPSLFAHILWLMVVISLIVASHDQGGPLPDL